MIDDYLDGQRTDGRSVGGEAAFTLDPQKVRSRVAGFCEQDSLYPIYRILQSVIRSAQGDVFILRQKSELQVSFKWPNCPSSQAFDDLLNIGTTAAFDQAGHRVGQHLFFGLSAALGTRDYKLRWTGPKGSFELSKGKFKILEASDSEFCQVALKLDDTWWKKLLGRRSEKQISQKLAYRVSYAPKKIHLDHELIRPLAPDPPEKPWSTKLLHGSELAWRFLRRPDENLMTVPYPNLDFYRKAKDYESFHLLRDPEDGCLPLSVTFHDPHRHNLKKGQTANLSLSLASRVHSALFLSLEAGRQDWLIPVADGVIAEAVPVKIAGGGIVAMTSSQDLSYDLSGLKAVQNEAWNHIVDEFRREAKSLKKQLAVSLGNMTFRSKTLPVQYDQAASYLVGGPIAGLWGGRLGPKFRSLVFRGEEKT